MIDPISTPLLPRPPVGAKKNSTKYFQTAPVCKIISYIEMLTALASVINLTAVSVERYS